MYSLTFSKSVFLREDIKTNANGTCFVHSPECTNVYMVRSCWNGCLTGLKVPSTYQDLLAPSCFSCWSDAKIRCRRSLTLISALEKLDGKASSSTLKFKSRGSSGGNRWRRRFAALEIFSGLGRAGHGSSSSSIWTWGMRKQDLSERFDQV